VGSLPTGVGVNSSTNRVYVANYGDNTVSVIDGSTNAVVATVGVGTSPIGVGVNSSTNRVYVANNGDNTVSVIAGPGVDNDLGLNVPAPVTATATSPQGAAVTYTATASDPDDATVPAPSCDHPSGSTFPIGTTTVTCSATDADDTPGTVSGSFTVTVNSPSTVSGNVPGPLTISSGTSLNGATVAGPVTILPGAWAYVANSTISGPLTSNGASALTVCGTTVSGPVSAQNTIGTLLLGGGPDATTEAADAPPCPANTFQGSVTLRGNHGPVELGGNQVTGPVSLTSNSSPGPAPEVEANTIGGPLGCVSNSPAPTNDGYPNAVSGPRSGQCSGL
jgi:YVTN family beta-propeller protein